MQEPKKYILPEYGECEGIEYEFRGKKFVQIELLTPVAEKAGELLMTLDLDGVNSITDLANGFSIGKVISAIMKKRMAMDVLALLLVHEDFTPCDPDEFRNSRASEFAFFAKRVIMDFFTLNDALFAPMINTVKKQMEAIRGLTELLPSLMSSLQLREEALPKEKKSTGSRGKTR